MNDRQVYIQYFSNWIGVKFIGHAYKTNKSLSNVESFIVLVVVHAHRNKT